MSKSESKLPQLSREELRRYSRQMILPEVGIHGQEKLKESRVLIVGLGGLGIPAAQYLAAAGIGTIGLMDDDIVDLSNLQRQVLYGESNIGRSKVETACKRLADLNPQIKIQVHNERLTGKNALQIIGGYDVVVDASDNFQTRYLINDTCILSGVPDVYGSVFKFEGQISAFGISGGPCYRCLYPIAPADELVPNCAESGVLGVLPGIIGAMQAAEVLKIVLEIGDLLSGRMLLFDLLSMKTNEIRLKRNPDCPVCGDHPAMNNFIDIANVKENTLTTETIAKNHSLSVENYFLMRKNNTQHLLLDIREQFEFDIANIGGELIPMNDLPLSVERLPHDKPIVVMCHVGIRSSRMTSYLKSEGFENVLNLTGGIDAWSRKIDHSVPLY